MDAARRAEYNRACIDGRAAVPDHTAIRIGFASSRAGSPSPATTATAGFMNSIISAKRAHMDNSNYPVNNKRRLMLRPRVKVDSSKWIGSQHLNFLSLPEDIVLRITAQLTLKEAVRMSVVCSNLRSTWIYHPNLDFGISTVPSGGASTVPGSVISTARGSKARSNQSSDQHKRMLSTKRFIDTVNFVLREHSGLAVNRIAIKFELGKEQAKDIDGWVSFAIASKAKAVILKFSPRVGPYENNYSFPYHLFNNQNASHLQVLQLYSVTLGPSPDICGFANLKMLSLEDACILQDFQCFLLKCPALEWLSISLCSQLHNLHAVEPLQRLKFLSVQDCAINKIELHAPNLSTFEYSGRTRAVIALHKCLKLKTASIAFIFIENLEYVFTELPNVLPHIETLHFSATVNSQIPGFTQAPFKFIYLRHLTMKIFISGDNRSGKNAILQLAYLLQAAAFLVDLHLDMRGVSECEYRPRRGVIVDRPHHNLKSACMTGYNGNGGQVALVKYILRNAVQLKRMAIDPKGGMQCQLLGPLFRTWTKLEFARLDKNGVVTIL